jgi:hypothetical protein
MLGIVFRRSVETESPRDCIYDAAVAPHLKSKMKPAEFSSLRIAEANSLLRKSGHSGNVYIETHDSHSRTNQPRKYGRRGSDLEHERSNSESMQPPYIAIHLNPQSCIHKTRGRHVLSRGVG